MEAVHKSNGRVNVRTDISKIAGRDHVRAPKCLPYSHAQTVTSVYGRCFQARARKVSGPQMFRNHTKFGPHFKGRF
jgi:hypothetical protein